MPAFCQIRATVLLPAARPWTRCANASISVFVPLLCATPPVCQSRPPFLEVVQLGLLRKGDYEVRSAADETVRGKLEVETKTSDNRDDYLYAPVDFAELSSASGSEQELTLRGSFPPVENGCMRLEEVRTYRTDNNVLIVQPIAKIVRGAACAAPKHSFVHTSKVSDPITEQGLIHVRTISGKSYNRLVTLR